MINNVIVVLVLSLLGIAVISLITGVVGGVWALTRAQADLVEEEDE